jgi:hypothetical protein
MHIHYYYGREIHPVETFGVMEVFMFPDYRKMGGPKYIVFHKNGKALESFRQKPAALRYAKQNQKG